MIYSTESKYENGIYYFLAHFTNFFTSYLNSTWYVSLESYQQKVKLSYEYRGSGLHDNMRVRKLNEKQKNAIPFLTK